MTLRDVLNRVFGRGGANDVAPNMAVNAISSPLGLAYPNSTGGAGPLANPSQAIVIAKAWDAYLGRFDRQINLRPGENDVLVEVNFCRLIVDKGISFLFGDDVAFEVKNNEAAQTYLDKIWKDNKKMSLLQKAALQGAVTGHSFIKINMINGTPKLTLWDSNSVSVEWQPDDISQITSYKIQWQAKNKDTGKYITVQQSIDLQENGYWLITDQYKEKSDQAWTIISQTDWNYPFAPVCECQNLIWPNEVFGLADLTEDIIGLNNAINLTQTNTNKIIKIFAHPRPVATGISSQQMAMQDVSPDRILCLPGDNTNLKYLEMHSDLQSSISHYKELKEALHEISHVPEILSGSSKTPLTDVSGIALKIMAQPLIERTESKRVTYGDMLEDLCLRILALGGFANVEVELHWCSILPTDPLFESQVGMNWQALGVSTDTILQRLGFDPELEENKKAEEMKEQADLGQQITGAFNRGQGLPIVNEVDTVKNDTA